MHDQNLIAQKLFLDRERGKRCQPRAQNLSVRKKPFRKFDFQLSCVNKCKTIRESDDETKKHSRTNPDVQFKEI